ncbi:MAG: energy-coupling factor ABC transporter permease [Casimicrobiaceae bacterium]
MNLLYVDVPGALAAWSWLALAVILAWATRRARWEHLAACDLTRVWHGSIIVIILLWSLKARLNDGFTFHLLGMAGITLMLGLPLALVSAALAVFVVAVMQQAAVSQVAIAWLTLGFVPIVTLEALRRASERHLPPNFFIYTFVIAFACTAVSVLAATLASLAAWSVVGERGFGELAAVYLPIVIQMGFGEALLTGMLITIFVVYKPHWVVTFDDARYLRKRSVD